MSATPNPDSELRQKLIAIEFKTMKEFNRPDYKNIVWRLGEDGIDQILEVLQPYLAARDRRLELEARIDELKKLQAEWFTDGYGNLEPRPDPDSSWIGADIYDRIEKLEIEKAALGSTERRQDGDSK